MKVIMNDSKKLKSTIYVLIAGIMWGLIGLFVRNLAKYDIPSMCIVFIRSFAGTILMALFLVIYDVSLFRIKLKDLWCFIGTGILSLTFFNLCYFTTMTLTSLSVSAILLYTAPSIVMFLSFFIFKERLNARKIIAVVLAFIGCVLVTGVIGSSSKVPGFAILTGLGAGFGYALYSIFARFALNKGYHSFTVTFYTLFMSVVGSVAFFDSDITFRIISDKPSTIGFMLLFGLISTTLPYIFYTLGLNGMESGKASIIASIEPVTATLVGVIVFHEGMTIMGMIGALVVLASIVIVNTTPKHTNS